MIIRKTKMEYTWGIKCTTYNCDYKCPHAFQFGGKCDTCNTLYCTNICQENDAATHLKFCASMLEERIQLWLKEFHMSSNIINIAIYHYSPFKRYTAKEKKYMHLCGFCGNNQVGANYFTFQKPCKRCQGSYRCKKTHLKVTPSVDYCNLRNETNLKMVLQHFNIASKDVFSYLFTQFIWCDHDL
jgi:hypothetical protein